MSSTPPTPLDEKLRRLSRLTDSANSARNRKFGEGRAVLLAPYLERVTGIGLRMETVRPHRYEEVERLVYATIVESELARKELTDRLELLKSTKIAGSGRVLHAVDRIRSQLPDFPEIRTIIVDESKAVVPCSSFLDLQKISRHLKEAGFAVAESKDRLGRKVLEATSRKGGKFSISATQVHFDYTVIDRDTGLFEEGLTRFVEFICLLPYVRPQWAVGSNVVYLNEIKPFFDLMFNVPENVLGGVFKDVSAVAEEGNLSERPEFRETHKSRILREKKERGDNERSFGLAKEYLIPHVDFIVVKENKDGTKLAVVGLNCAINLAALEKALAEKEGAKLFMATPKTTVDRSKIYINKGNCFELRRVKKISSSTAILDEEGRKVAKILSPSTIMVPLDEGTKGAAAELLDLIYDRMLFYTPRIRSDEMGDSRLTELERQVVTAVDSLVDFYNYFLKVDHEKEAFRVANRTGTKPQDVTARGWLIAKLGECPSPRFEAKVLHALKAIRVEVDPGKFSMYGDRSMELYEMLSNMIGRMEAVCSIPVPQEGAPPQPN